ncbi:MAG TPA: S-methyl-5-thioribose-1-phosphate isomerase [Verrucomicrobiales bacterium]|nr:S-methyl-5-thioribose-1-phosphate isomerase [Verrucomicrobiales bacterium]
MIDQRCLPHDFIVVAMKNYQATAAAIRDMIVRGAGAIGATAAFGLAQGARAFRGQSLGAFNAHIQTVHTVLKSARPTAVDPVNALNAVRREMQRGATVREQQQLAVAAAQHFADADIAHCRAIGTHGAPLIRNGATVLTHCNAGWLAFVDIGTATAPIYAAQNRGRDFLVLCDETRPRCQGASLTAWELAQQGIRHHVIADNAAGDLMQRGKIDLVLVGSDRVLGHTGHVANKIGTYSTAVLAHRHGIPFYVAIPLSTIDWNLKSWKRIPIEERSGDEVLGAWGALHPSIGKTPRSKVGSRAYVRIANPTSTALNPGFDVTPPELITGIITPHGILRPGELIKLKRFHKSSATRPIA